MKQFNTDCEGPLTKNDNAYELTAHFIPQGDRLFRQLSTYDDILAYLIKKPNYNAGGTLKLILPFLKAYNLSNQKIEKFSKNNFILVPGIIPTLKFLQKIMPCFIISTSYRPYIRALCKMIGFPEKNTCATEVDLDNLKIDEKEKTKLKNYAQEITALPDLELPAKVKKFSQLSEKTKKSVQRLNQIFWDEMGNLRSSKFLDEVKPVGGREKAEAILVRLKETRSKLIDSIYVGDSITDREALDLVRKNGGLTISFNGNRYAIEVAKIAVISPNAYILAIIGDLFSRFDKEKVLELCKNWTPSLLPGLRPSSALGGSLSDPSPLRGRGWRREGQAAEVFLVTEKNKEKIIKKSETFRKTFRGEKIGGIG